MLEKREYIITLHKHEDLDQFYDDLENIGEGIHQCLPHRELECVARRPVSRNTHYLLNDYVYM